MVTRGFVRCMDSSSCSVAEMDAAALQATNAMGETACAAALFSDRGTYMATSAATSNGILMHYQGGLNAVLNVVGYGSSNRRGANPVTPKRASRGMHQK